MGKPSQVPKKSLEGAFMEAELPLTVTNPSPVKKPDVKRQRMGASKETEWAPGRSAAGNNELHKLQLSRNW
jgi:hypothetical protein